MHGGAVDSQGLHYRRNLRALVWLDGRVPLVPAAPMPDRLQDPGNSSEIRKTASVESYGQALSLRPSGSVGQASAHSHPLDELVARAGLDQGVRHPFDVF